MPNTIVFTSERFIGAIKYFAPEMLVNERWHWCNRFDAQSADNLKHWLDSNGYKPKRITEQRWDAKDTLQKLGWLIDGIDITSHVDAEGSLFLFPKSVTALEK
jgi:hypothetical protein